MLHDTFTDCSCIIRIAGDKSAVRKLFRDKGTGKFLRLNGKWTPDMVLAFDFLSTYQPELPYRARGQKDVEWLYSFDLAHSTVYDFTKSIDSLVRKLRKRKK
jgi:hypothetical protein